MNGKEFDSIIKDITTINGIAISHRVNMYSDTAKDYVKAYVSTRSKGGKEQIPSFYFKSTKDAIIIKSGYNENNVHNSVYLGYDNLVDFRNMYKTVMDWFVKYNNDLFEYDSKNIPYAVNQAYDKLVHIIYLNSSGMFNSQLIVRPCIVKDNFTQGSFPGIALYCNSGVIGQCTIKNFENLCQIVIKCLESLYSISMELINQYLLIKNRELTQIIIKNNK